MGTVGDGKRGAGAGGGGDCRRCEALFSWQNLPNPGRLWTPTVCCTYGLAHTGADTHTGWNTHVGWHAHGQAHQRRLAHARWRAHNGVQSQSMPGEGGEAAPAGPDGCGMSDWNGAGLEPSRGGSRPTCGLDGPGPGRAGSRSGRNLVGMERVRAGWRNGWEARLTPRHRIPLSAHLPMSLPLQPPQRLRSLPPLQPPRTPQTKGSWTAWWQAWGPHRSPWNGYQRDRRSTSPGQIG